MTIKTFNVEAAQETQRYTFGSSVLPDRSVQFRFWAPKAQSVEVRIISDTSEKDLPMKQLERGWFSLTTNEAAVGSLYKYVVDKELAVPDPASRYQPQDVHGPSMVVDQGHYRWTDDSWSGKPWEEAVIYEMHVGTFTPEGTFAAAAKKLDYLKDLGITVVELMPVADFPGKWNWGYDGVLLFAPDSTYGTPDELRAFIDEAHNRGIMVFLDVVYNHFGPEGNYLHAYASSFFTKTHKTPWGDAINFDSNDSDIVREFFIENVLYWLSEFRFDGLRFDAVHAIRDDSKVHILEQIATAVRTGPGKERLIHLVLENDDNTASLLEREDGKPIRYDAQWNDDIHHALHVIGTGECSGYYSDYAEGTSSKPAVAHLACCLTSGFAYQNDPSALRDGERRGEKSEHLPSTAFVSFLQNHDQIGNRAFGDRFASIAKPLANRALSAVLILNPSIPLLYMGQEWGATTPFYFFCDLGPDLAPLVTEGRRNEFAKFKEFQDPAVRERIPDPVKSETYLNSKLNWSDLQSAEHQQWLQYHRTLLNLRAKHVVPMLYGVEKNNGELVEQSNSLILAEWNYAERGTLQMVANLADVKTTSKKLDQFSKGALIFESSKDTFADLKNGTVDPWTVVWTIKQ